MCHPKTLMLYFWKLLISTVSKIKVLMYGEQKGV